MGSLLAGLQFRAFQTLGMKKEEATREKPSPRRTLGLYCHSSESTLPFATVPGSRKSTCRGSAERSGDKAKHLEAAVSLWLRQMSELPVLTCHGCGHQAICGRCSSSSRSRFLPFNCGGVGRAARVGCPCRGCSRRRGPESSLSSSSGTAGTGPPQEPRTRLFPARPPRVSHGNRTGRNSFRRTNDPREPSCFHGAHQNADPPAVPLPVAPDKSREEN